MDRELVKAIQSEVREAVAAVAAKHGLKIAKNTARYGDSYVSFTVTMETVGENGESLRDKAVWDSVAHLLGLKPEDYGRLFRSGAHSFKLCGISLSSPKYPILAKQLGSFKTFKFPEDIVRVALGYPPKKRLFGAVSVRGPEDTRYEP
jgi:hypothetical protein